MTLKTYRDLDLLRRFCFIEVVEAKLPDAKAVADCFHVMQNLNKALDDCGRQAKRESDDVDIWKQAKYALLKNREDLTEE